MTEKRFLKGYHTIRDKEENKIYDFRIENVLFLLNELDEKYVDEYALRETLQVDLQRVEKENEQLKHDATVLICSNQEYRKENEKLKQHIDFADKLIDDLGHNEMKRQWEEYE